MGRSLLNTLYNLNVAEQYTEALREMGYRWGSCRASGWWPASMLHHWGWRLQPGNHCCTKTEKEHGH